MQFNEDKRIKAGTPFLHDRSVLYAGNGMGVCSSYVESNKEEILDRMRVVGCRFLFLPDLCGRLSPEMLRYMFPGVVDTPLARDLYHHVRDAAGLGDRSGFLYKFNGQAYFRIIAGTSEGDVESALDDFVAYLGEQREVDDRVMFSKGPLEDNSRPLQNSDELQSVQDGGESEVGESQTLRVQRIIEAWEKIEEEFGITIEDLDALLGYRVSLSRMVISASGKVCLIDWDGGTEVRMDDLTKALYFFYLRHPEGVALKDLQAYEEEILHHYMTITGRDDQEAIRKSVDNLLNPFGNNVNVSLSRIKKAFRDVVGDRIARFYYVDGRHAGPRKVAVDRSLVIWEG